MNKELENRIDEVHAKLVEARDSAQAGLKLLADLRLWITRQEIERLKKEAQ